MKDQPDRKPGKQQTEHSDCEQQLLAYQTKISNILESFTDAYFEVDLNWVVTYWNAEAEKLLARSREEVIGHNLWEVYADAVHLKFYTEYHKAVKDHVAVRFEEYFPPKKLWVEVAAFPTGNGLSVYFKDITEHKNAMLQLENEKQKYIDLFNLSPVPQWVYDIHTLNFLDVNEGAINYYGYSRAEFLQMSIKDIRPPEEVEVLEEILCNEGSVGFFNKSTVRHQKKDGSIIHVCVEGNKILFEGKEARLVMIIDRTKEIETQKALEDREQRFSALVEHGSDIIAILDNQAKYSFVTSSAKSVLGISSKEFIGKEAMKYIHPEDRAKIATLYQSLENKKKVVLPPFRFKDNQGGYRWMETVLTNMMDDGAVGGIVSNSRDITQRIENELKTEESITRFNTVSKATSDAIWDWDMRSGELIWNQGIKGIFGYQQTAYTAQWRNEHIHPDDLEEVTKKFSSIIEQHKTRLKVEYRFRCADGSYRFVLDRAFLTFDKNGVPIRMIGSMQDITERINYIKAIEAQNARLKEISWIQSHKLRAPLANILGLVEMIDEDITDLHTVKQTIPYLRSAAELLDTVLNDIVKKANS